MAKWLVKNNKKLNDEFAGSRMNISQRAQSKIPYIKDKLEKLEELNIITKSKGKIETQRNKDLKTYIYSITPRGFLSILIYILQNQTDKNSDAYKNIARCLLNHWLTYIPPGYKDHNNHYYYILKEILESSIDNHTAIVLSFFRFMQQYESSFDINFSELREHMNYIFYIEILQNYSFKKLFYKTINELNSKHFSKLLLFLNKEEIEKIKESLKFQFKLDIESQVDKLSSDNLKLDNFTNQKDQFVKNIPNEIITMKEVFENTEAISKEIVFTFDVKNRWERMRNTNSSRFNIITVITKCNNCNMIYPYPFEIESDIVNEINCRFCKKPFFI